MHLQGFAALDDFTSGVNHYDGDRVTAAVQLMELQLMADVAVTRDRISGGRATHLSTQKVITAERRVCFHSEAERSVVRAHGLIVGRRGYRQTLVTGLLLLRG